MDLQTPAQSDSSVEQPRLSTRPASSMQSLCQNPATQDCATSINATRAAAAKPPSQRSSDFPAVPVARSNSPQKETPPPKTLAQVETMVDVGTLESYAVGSSEGLRFDAAINEIYEPPVTKASLAELDLVRIMDDPKLRHDLNFEREISFRPNLEGILGLRKLERAREYWEALTFEFGLYSRSRSETITEPSSPQDMAVESRSLIDFPTLRRMSVRLPLMFEAVRDILKTLVPGSEWSTIDERLDVPLLMQELENGVCDIKGLGDWLGKLLLGSCSPVRDPIVYEMVSKVHAGASHDDPRLLVAALRCLFGILEMMKLDVANHQIRYLRLLLVEDSISYEQREFLSRIASGWDVASVREWYKSYDDGDLEEMRPEDRVQSFVRGVTALVVNSERAMPKVLCYDHERLRVLQAQFGFEICYRACLETLKERLKPYHLHRFETEDSRRLGSRVAALLGNRADLPFHNIAVEIARELNRQRKVAELPCTSLVRCLESELRERLDPETATSARLRSDLGFDLGKMVLQEFRILDKLTPLRILDRLNSQELTYPVGELCGLPMIARRTAHIATMHWRVWAPILYEQPEHSIKNKTDMSISIAKLSLGESTCEVQTRDGSQELGVGSRHQQRRN